MEVVRRIDEEYGERLHIFSSHERGKDLAGSNMFGIFAVDEQVRDMGARVARPEDSEFLLALDKMPERTGAYKDSGAVLDLGAVIDFSGKNHELALRLYHMLGNEQQDLDRFPAVLTDLITRLSHVGKYGLALEPSSKYPVQMRTAKILSGRKGTFRSDDSNLLVNGIPSQLGRGKRRLFTTEQKPTSLGNLGLSALYLGTYLDLIVKGDNLAPPASSGSFGQVLLVSSENPMQDLAVYGTRLASMQRRY
jgi:hypothetical protein